MKNKQIFEIDNKISEITDDPLAQCRGNGLGYIALARSYVEGRKITIFDVQYFDTKKFVDDMTSIDSFVDSMPAGRRVSELNLRIEDGSKYLNALLSYTSELPQEVTSKLDDNLQKKMEKAKELLDHNKSKFFVTGIPIGSPVSLSYAN